MWLQSHREMTTKKMYRYTKDTLLAFASLPSCQTRPDGIDPVLWRDSVNSDVVERNIAIPVVAPARGLVRRDSDLAYSKSPVDDIPEWRRPNGGGAILQSGPRRKPYEEEPMGNAFSSSYPPRPSGPWVDQNGPIRPPHDRPGPNGPPGRWDRNGDRDRERGRLPQEWDADEGGPGGKGDVGQRPWVERDGLLGSGNRPPPPGHNRIGRPADNYQPSRPLIKTPSYGRREDTDIVNDETFGFLETSNDDRSLEERKRRESFELMRKEQHRQLQEHKQPLTKSDDSTVNRKHDENSLWDNNLSHQSPPLSPIGKTVVPPIPTPPRPAVPPGFSKVVQQRQTLLQQEDEAEGSLHPPAKDASIKDQTSLDSDKTDDSSSAHSSSSVADIKEVKCATLVAKEMIIELDVVETKVVVTEAIEGSALNGSLPSLSGTRSRKVPDVWSFSLEAQDGDSVSDILSTEDAGSIRKESLLDKLFGNAAPTIIDDVVLPSDLLRDEPPIAAPEEDGWSESLSKTSKFAHWFHTEEDKFTTSQTNSSKNLMSLFGNTDDTVSVKKDVPSTTTTIAPGIKSGFIRMPVGPSLEDIEKGLNHSAPKNGVIKRPSPVFMTCEDIEQALLAEAGGGDSHSRAPPPPTVAAPAPEDIAPPKDAASASQHLLALLLKRPEMDDASPILGVGQAWKKPEPSGNQVHTLETLFNKAFMSELQSSEPARMFPDESLEMAKPTEDFIPKPSWFNSWNNMWPDSKDVEAGGYLKEPHHPVSEDSTMASAPPLPGLWGKNDDKSNKPFPEVVPRKPAFLRPQAFNGDLHMQPPSFQFQHPQILQRPQFHYGMVMPEQDVLKPPQPQVVHWQQQQQQQQQPPFLAPPFQTEFQSPPTKGGYGGNSVERWFGMDARRGLMGPNGVFPQAPLGVEGDMKLRYD